VSTRSSPKMSAATSASQFAGQRTDLWHAMWANIRPCNQTSPEAIGRLWCEGACDTAWRIYSACESAEHRDKVLDTLYDLKP
jgi:hypothetical protein